MGRTPHLGLLGFEAPGDVALARDAMARVDFFVTDDMECLVNEINTMPGFTPISGFPKKRQRRISADGFTCGLNMAACPWRSNGR